MLHSTTIKHIAAVGENSRLCATSTPLDAYHHTRSSSVNMSPSATSRRVFILVGSFGVPQRRRRDRRSPEVTLVTRCSRESDRNATALPG